MLRTHIDRLATRRDFGSADLAKWALKVTLCGKGLEPKKRGQTRTEEGVYTQNGNEKVKNLGGRNPTPSQRDEAVANYHVQYIIDNSFPPPSAGAGERERLLTCLYYPFRTKEQNNPSE